jgi:hypothetical protein
MFADKLPIGPGGKGQAMIITLDFNVIATWLGGAVCIVGPVLVIALAAVRYKVVRRDGLSSDKR